jgi:hypothetical protein
MEPTAPGERHHIFKKEDICISLIFMYNILYLLELEETV